MSKTERLIHRIAKRFAKAQAGIGAATVHDVLDAMRGMTAASLMENPELWQKRVEYAIKGHSQRSRDIGIAYYQLIRAIGTGTSVRGFGDDDGDTTLNHLAARFERLSGVKLPHIPRGTQTVEFEASVFDRHDLDHEHRSSAASFYARGHAKVTRERDKAKARGRLDDADFDKELADKMRKFEADIARDASRISRNGGRDAVHNGMRRDPKPIRFYRLTDADPCYFCAMLASRGARYASEKSASRKDNGESYHPCCNCQPVPIFTNKHTLPELNRKFEAMWKSFDGSSRVKSWEWRHFYNKNRNRN